MKREIKFRAWDNIDYMSHPFKLLDLQLRNVEFSNSYPVMQFTGLLDKNGKEIYEGDIVQSGGSMVFSNPAVTAGALREIFGHRSGFVGIRIGNSFDKQYPNSGDNWSNHTLWNVQRDLKIIGNIYEHPHLLIRDSCDAVSDTTGNNQGGDAGKQIKGGN